MENIGELVMEAWADTLAWTEGKGSRTLFGAELWKRLEPIYAQATARQILGSEEWLKTQFESLSRRTGTSPTTWGYSNVMPKVAQLCVGKQQKEQADALSKRG
jgi:hypothetical protein